jgi:acetyl-CoA carboxylase biotin carboxylase subunit
MNTRLQVEHPVTELATGLDLVDWQLRIAMGEKLAFTQADVTWRGWAIECRIYAEDPAMNFLPAPGRIEQLSMPAGPGIRLDSGVYPGWTVPMDYDPLLAKMAVWGDTRETATRRMLRALEECAVFGIKTNIGFFKAILADPAFGEGKLHTGFIEEFFKRSAGATADVGIEEIAALAAAWHSRQQVAVPAAGEAGRWLTSGRERMFR